MGSFFPQFFASFAIEAKRGVEFRHSTYNAFKIGRESGAEFFNTRLHLPTLLHMDYSVKLEENGNAAMKWYPDAQWLL